jgi:hypothetical protein
MEVEIIHSSRLFQGLLYEENGNIAKELGVDDIEILTCNFKSKKRRPFFLLVPNRPCASPIFALSGTIDSRYKKMYIQI